MDTKHWNKITNNSPTSHGSYIKSKPTGKCNNITSSHPTEKRTSWKKSPRKKYIFNKLRHIQEIGNKLIIIPTRHTTPDHIGDVVNSYIR